MKTAADPAHRPRPFQDHPAGYRWSEVDLLEYKAEGSAPFKDVTRQVLFDDPAAGYQWRYFEVAAGGHTTLERHEHTHAVMILRGTGTALVGTNVTAFGPYDLYRVPPMTWHQFSAAPDEAMGFLCLVPAERDRPQLPTEDDLAELRRNREIAAIIRV